ERIDVLDAGTGTALNSQTVASFASGQYVVWNVAGHVQFRVTNLVGGSNAVISGLFFGGMAASAATSVNLTSAFNRTRILGDGATFGGGLDGGGTALSANLLGTSVNWNGTTFNLGTPNSNNVISAAGQTINLPAGNFTSLKFLATGVNGNQAN